MPSAVDTSRRSAAMGTPGADHFDAQGRHHLNGSGVSFPADDYTDPAPVATFAHLTPPSRSIAPYRGSGPVPGCGTLSSNSRILDATVVDRSTMKWRDAQQSAAALQGPAGTSSRSWEWTSSRTRTSWWWAAPAGSSASCRSRCLWRRGTLAGRALRARGRYRARLQGTDRRLARRHPRAGLFPSGRYRRCPANRR